MTRPERDLVAALRAELAAIDPSRPCDRRAEAAGLAAGRPAREGPVARLAVRLGEGERARRPRRTRPRRARSVRLGRSRPSTAGWPASAACSSPAARSAWPAAGPTSSSSSRPPRRPLLAARLEREELPAAWRLRRGRGVVTWKNADTVGLFLRRIGAGGALLELEARQVARALRGDLNRVLNAESANLQRAVGAAGRQLAAIEELEADGRLADQPPIVRLVADARRETPEATLGELAERLQVHRSTVQRALERIEHLALHPDEGIGRRDAGGAVRHGPGAAARSGMIRADATRHHRRQLEDEHDARRRRRARRDDRVADRASRRSSGSSARRSSASRPSATRSRGTGRRGRRPGRPPRGRGRLHRRHLARRCSPASRRG